MIPKKVKLVLTVGGEITLPATKCKQIGGRPHIQSTAKKFKVKALQLAPVLRVAFLTCSDHNKSRGRDTVLSQFNCLHFVLRRTLNDL